MDVIAQAQSRSGQRLAPAVEVFGRARRIVQCELLLSGDLRAGHILDPKSSRVVRSLIHRVCELPPARAHRCSFQTVARQQALEFGCGAVKKISNLEIGEAEFAY